jgi:hypothetical protein
MARPGMVATAGPTDGGGGITTTMTCNTTRLKTATTKRNHPHHLDILALSLILSLACGAASRRRGGEGDDGGAEVNTSSFQVESSSSLSQASPSSSPSSDNTVSSSKQVVCKFSNGRCVKSTHDGLPIAADTETVGAAAATSEPALDVQQLSGKTHGSVPSKKVVSFRQSAELDTTRATDTLSSEQLGDIHLKAWEAQKARRRLFL